jgi:uncharacterized protein YjiS (DUF1127 family)
MRLAAKSMARATPSSRGADQAAFFARLAKAISQHRRYVSTWAQLHALTDRDLADKGISR